MQFAIAPEVFERLPNLRIAAAVTTGLDNQVERSTVRAYWGEAWRSAAADSAQYGNAQSQPLVKPWRDAFQRMGVSGKQFPSSVEALLRRALKGGEPFTINALVDWYNAVSLRHYVPAGGFDLAELSAPLELRLSRAGDTFMALDDAEALEVPPGEVSYATGATILTRHIVWRQAKTALITPQTRDVILVSEVLAELGADASAAVADAFARGLRDFFGVPSQTWVLDAAQPAIAW
ncbi:MAG: B3/B4 domain-containing protein [Ktedonobacterales bacterium]